MKIKYLSLLIGAVILVGCGQVDYDFKGNGTNIKIQSKKQWGEKYCKYSIRGFDVNNYYSDELSLILPNNFGEVNYIVTITNGIQAWKP